MTLSDHNINEDIAKKAKRKYWIRACTTLLALILVSSIIIPQLRPSAADKLKEMDRLRAIPDEENAALIYVQLLNNWWSPTDLSDFADYPSYQSYQTRHAIHTAFTPQYQVGKIEDRYEEENTCKRPWTAKEYPFTARFIHNHAYEIEILRQASKLNECRFLLAADRLNTLCFSPPIYSHHSTWEATWQFILRDTIEKSKHVLVQAAYLDLGEHRYLEAYQKALILITIGCHLEQHPMADCLRRSLDAKAKAVRILNTLLILSPSSVWNPEDYPAIQIPSLDSLEQAKSHIYSVMEIIHEEGQDRARKTDRSIVQWGQYIWRSLKNGRRPQFSKSQLCDYDYQFDEKGYSYHCYLAETQKYHLLSQIRQYKESHGQWPTSLEPFHITSISTVQNQLHPDEPFIFWCSDQCFVIDLPNAKNSVNRTDPNNLLVCDGRKFSPKERARIDYWISSQIESLARSSDQAYDQASFLDRANRYDQLNRMGAFTTLILINNLYSLDNVIRRTSIRMLAINIQKNESLKYGYPREEILKHLISGYKRETIDELKYQYIRAFYCCNDLASEQKEFQLLLLEIAEQSPFATHRALASSALITTQNVDIIRELILPIERFDDPNFLGEEDYESVWEFLYRISLLQQDFIIFLKNQSAFDTPFSDLLTPDKKELLKQWWQTERD